ncbi:MAG TPA: peptide-N-glycosidase F-related protein [Chitinophaga sp.]
MEYYNGYSDSSYTEGNGVIYLNNTVVLKRISLKGKVKPGADITGELRVYQRGDGYDRDGQVYFLSDSTVKRLLNGKTTFDAAGKKAVADYVYKPGYLFVTPFFFWYQSIKSVPYTFNLNDMSALLTGDQPCWVAVSVWGVPWKGTTAEGNAYDWNLQDDQRTFAADFNIVADNDAANANPDYVQSIQFGRITNADGSNTATLNSTVTIPARLKNARIVVISQSWGGIEEYTYHTHQVSWDGAQIGSFSTQVNCGPNTMRDFDIFSPPRNWCPSEVVTPHATAIPGTVDAKSTHTVQVKIVNGVADDNNNFKLSVYITGTKY